MKGNCLYGARVEVGNQLGSNDTSSGSDSEGLELVWLEWEGEGKMVRLRICFEGRTDSTCQWTDVYEKQREKSNDDSLVLEQPAE